MKPGGIPARHLQRPHAGCRKGGSRRSVTTAGCSEELREVLMVPAPSMGGTGSPSDVAWAAPSVNHGLCPSLPFLGI